MVLVGCKKNTGDLIGTYLVNDSIQTRLTFSEDGYYDWIQKGSYQYEGNSKFLITYSDDITSELEVIIKDKGGNEVLRAQRQKE